MYFNNNITYTASSGNVYNLKTNGILTKEANYHTWAWDPQGTELQYGQRVSSFSRAAAVYNTTLLFYGTKLKRTELITAFHEDIELDLQTMRTGRIDWGGWYVDCYITTSDTTPAAGDWTENAISIFCPRPFWIKEEKKTFLPQDEPAAQDFLDYTFDYQYDYFLGAIGSQRWVRSFPFDTNFRMYIYGPVSNPRIAVNGYPYQVNDTLEATEYLVIDSRENTIIKYLANNTNVSIFDLRNKTESVFNKIPAGTLNLTWTGLFGFDLVLFDERSEPVNEVVL